MWLHWTTLQLLYWCGVSPKWLFPLVPPRSSRERVKSLRREVLRKFGSNKHASFMLRMRLSLDCGCVTVATQGGHDNRFTVITRTVALSLSMIFLHR
jgi:hypothetical protein